MKTSLFFIVIFISSTLSATGQGKSGIIAKNAGVEKAGDGFTFTEGPAVAPDGRVYFTDQPNDKIYIWDEKKGVSLWLEGTGRSNGMYFGKRGVLVTCADEKNELGYFDENNNLVVLHEGYDGKHLNGPNDLWISPAGGTYFTDPYYHRPWWPEGHKEEQDVRGVYFLNQGGDIIRVIDDYKTLYKELVKPKTYIEDYIEIDNLEKTIDIIETDGFGYDYMFIKTSNPKDSLSFEVVDVKQNNASISLIFNIVQ